jgi:proteasome lid subunit RPN8/RPN11
MTVSIASGLIDQIVSAAQRSFVAEVCGLLLSSHAGPVSASASIEVPMAENEPVMTIEAVVACVNVAADPARRFEIDPAALLSAHRAARRGGPAVVGHYHSHPSGDPTPSPRDAADAAADGSIWLIAGSIAGHVEVRGWRAVAQGAVHGRFDPIALRVTA